MRNAFLTLLLLVAFLKIGFSQNLVPNPGFEQAIHCDTVHGPVVIDTAETPTTYLKNWFIPKINNNLGITNLFIYFNNCFLPPKSNYVFHNRNTRIRSGQASTGLYLYAHASWLTGNIFGWRSFARVKLLKELQANCVYRVQFYVHVGKEIGYDTNDYGAVDAIGAYLSTNNDSAIVGTTKPQISNTKGNLLNDSTQFVLISGFFTASGGEKYLTIGNFKLNDSTNFQQFTFRNPLNVPRAFYFLDDVSVVPVTAANYSLNIGPDQLLCNNQPVNQTLTAPAGFASYQWSTGETTASISITQPGTYWVNADFGCGFLTDTIRIRTRQDFEQGFSIGHDTLYCANAVIILPLQAKSAFTSYRWNTGATTRTINATAPGKYWVEATYACGSITDTIEIKQFTPSGLFAFRDTVLCSGQTLNLSAASGFASYQWNTGETSQQVQIMQAGKYKVRATTAEGCMTSDSVQVKYLVPLAGFSLGKDTVLCENGSLQISIAPKPGINYLWHDGLQTASRIIKAAGNYRLTASDRCSSFTDEIEVSFQDCNTVFIPNLVTPNKDGQNDFFRISTPTKRKMNVEIYNRWGIRIYQQDDYRNNWPTENLSSGIYYYLVTDPELNKTYKGWLEVVK
ncbi:gliding motility-associated C-terminal domain-containing protein [Adhaeribacter soli]|uniref:Gliding motility-associated C-terminal domain-containing protein n=1 Tax=Adhaeribacter soli TaxID=2607655 RepID=A0A5N1INQ1_9BACT|nr:gliding motility-associated C-terminal domain-containing protein [Adhaeribacter soli]KAA9325401.1 gliding motility-associated C-terminal domain-containing protein [Adhaeribacter soli]